MTPILVAIIFPAINVAATWVAVPLMVGPLKWSSNPLPLPAKLDDFTSHNWRMARVLITLCEADRIAVLLERQRVFFAIAGYVVWFLGVAMIVLSHVTDFTPLTFDNGFSVSATDLADWGKLLASVPGVLGVLITIRATLAVRWLPNQLAALRSGAA